MEATTTIGATDDAATSPPKQWAHAPRKPLRRVVAADCDVQPVIETDEPTQNGIALLDTVLRDLGKVRLGVVSRDDQLLVLGVLMAGVAPAETLVDRDALLRWREDIAAIYGPFWNRLRAIELAMPGVADAAGGLPTPNTVWGYVARVTGRARPLRRAFAPDRPHQAWFAWAREDALAALGRLCDLLYGRHRARLLRFARLAGPRGKAIARDRCGCRPAHTFTLVVVRWPRIHRAYLINDKSPKDKRAEWVAPRMPPPDRTRDRDVDLVCDAIKEGGDRGRNTSDDGTAESDATTAYEAKCDDKGIKRAGYTAPTRPLLPRRFLCREPDGQDRVARSGLTRAIDAVAANDPESMGLTCVTLFDLPPTLGYEIGRHLDAQAPPDRPESVQEAPPTFYMAVLNECDLVAHYDILGHSSRMRALAAAIKRTSEAQYPSPSPERHRSLANIGSWVRRRDSNGDVLGAGRDGRRTEKRRPSVLLQRVASARLFRLASLPQGRTSPADGGGDASKGHGGEVEDTETQVAAPPTRVKPVPLLIEYLLRANRLADLCGQRTLLPADEKALIDATTLLGIDADDAAYTGRPDLLCGDVCAAIECQYT